VKKLNSMIAALAVIALTGTAACLVGCKHMDSDEHGTAHMHTYTCKMHPEVTQDTPGNCPKCGMKLTKKDS
jgi:Cu(I)/Ag(I) efflux system membrane fusion protein